MGREEFEETLTQSENIQQLAFVLEGLSNIDPSPAVRDLAETLRGVMTNKAE